MGSNGTLTQKPMWVKHCARSTRAKDIEKYKVAMVKGKYKILWD